MSSCVSTSTDFKSLMTLQRERDSLTVEDRTRDRQKKRRDTYSLQLLHLPLFLHHVISALAQQALQRGEERWDKTIHMLP